VSDASGAPFRRLTTGRWSGSGSSLRARQIVDAPDPRFEPRIAIAELASRITASLDRFEALLSGRDFLFGDALTAADVTAFPFLKYALLWTDGDPDRFHEILRETMPLGDRYPRLEAWIRRIDDLPRA